MPVTTSSHYSYLKYYVESMMVSCEISISIIQYSCAALSSYNQYFPCPIFADHEND